MSDLLPVRDAPLTGCRSLGSRMIPAGRSVITPVYSHICPRSSVPRVPFLPAALRDPLCPPSWSAGCEERTSAGLRHLEPCSCSSGWQGYFLFGGGLGSVWTRSLRRTPLRRILNSAGLGIFSCLDWRHWTPAGSYWYWNWVLGRGTRTWRRGFLGLLTLSALAPRTTTYLDFWI